MTDAELAALPIDMVTGFRSALNEYRVTISLPGRQSVSVLGAREESWFAVMRRAATLAASAPAERRGSVYR